MKTPQNINTKDRGIPKNFLKGIVFLLLCTTISLQANAQNITYGKFFDSAWRHVPKEDAAYITRLTRQDDMYYENTVYAGSNKLRREALYKDTGMFRPLGLTRGFYENGHLQDSMLYDENSDLQEGYHYYPSGKLWVHAGYKGNNKKSFSDGFEENGKPIKDFIYTREAGVKGGQQKWRSYLEHNLKMNTPIDNHAPRGTYTVIVKFIVDTNGDLTDVDTETHFGFGMEKEVMRIIQNSPPWEPAIYMNKPVKAYRRQPITFVIQE